MHFRIFQRVITSCSHTFKREHFATLGPFFHRSFRTSGSQRDGTLVPLRGHCKPAKSSFAFGAQVPLQLVDVSKVGLPLPLLSSPARHTAACQTPQRLLWGFPRTNPLQTSVASPKVGWIPSTFVLRRFAVVFPDWLTQRMATFSNTANLTLCRNEQCIHFSYKQLWIANRGWRVGAFSRLLRSPSGGAKIHHNLSRCLSCLRLTHQALKYRRLTIAGPLEGKVLLYFCSPRSPASSAMAS